MHLSSFKQHLLASVLSFSSSGWKINHLYKPAGVDLLKFATDKN